MRKNEKVTMMGKLAESYFRKGYCCTEAIFKASIDLFSLNIPEDALRMASGFCGGMGNRESTCGVYSGGVIVTGILAGRSTSRDSAELSRDLSGLYTKRLRAEINEMICKDLLDNMGFIGNMNKRGCRKLTKRGAEILAEIVLENRLEDSRDQAASTTVKTSYLNK